MSCRYQIRIFESVEKDGATSAGTVVAPVAHPLSIYAYSGDDAEKCVRKDVAKGKLARGKVYQILPLIGNAELTRSLAVAMDGSFERVFLDPASGLYSECRRIRLPRPTPATEPEAASSVAVAAPRQA